MANNQYIKPISIFPLVMLITGAIDSIRNLPTTALFGSTLVFFFIFAAIVFLIPIALISAQLSSKWTQESGVFHWIRLAFGEKLGFFAIWLQWINTMVWYPTILSFIAGTTVFYIDPQLANNKFFLITVILSVFWFLTLLNLRGLQTSARFASICAVIGMIIPMALIIILAILWIIQGKPIHISLSIKAMVPNMEEFHSWISLTAIIASFLGIELATVHVRQVKNPQKSFPLAMLYSVIIILTTMIFGSLAIAMILPKHSINLVEGIMQAFTAFFEAYHLSGLIPVIAIMILIGSVGSMINWIISPARGLLQASQYGFLPEFLAKENRFGVASNLLLLQAILVSLISAAFLFMPNVNASYWLLTDLSTQLYVIMYIIMFTAALKLYSKHPEYENNQQTNAFEIPGKKFGLWLTATLGLIGCVVTLIVGFFPPQEIEMGGFGRYEILFCGGIILAIVPVFIFYSLRNKKRIHSNKRE